MDEPLKDEEIKALKQEVQKLIEEDIPIKWSVVNVGAEIPSSMFVRVLRV